MSAHRSAWRLPGSLQRNDRSAVIRSRMKSSSFYVACVASLAMVWSAGCATAPRTTGVSRPPDVIYVPTSPEMVDVMLKMADVKPGEMVYDLGCGDGRIVVTAARDFGARGIGVDIDPERIRESRQNVRDAKVGDRVQIKYADLFEMDFSDADVVALYLLPALNLRLRPRILNELRPGTRIVSNSFDMDDWRPDQQEEDPSTGQSMYFWVVPAKVQGKWTLALPGEKPGTLYLLQTFQELSGTVRIDDRTMPLRDLRLRGTTVSFTLGEAANIRHATAEVTGGRMSGTIRQGEAGPEEPWTGQLTL